MTLNNRRLHSSFIKCTCSACSSHLLLNVMISSCRFCHQNVMSNTIVNYGLTCKVNELAAKPALHGRFCRQTSYVTLNAIVNLGTKNSRLTFELAANRAAGRLSGRCSVTSSKVGCSIYYTTTIHWPIIKYYGSQSTGDTEHIAGVRYRRRPRTV